MKINEVKLYKKISDNIEGIKKCISNDTNTVIAVKITSLVEGLDEDREELQTSLGRIKNAYFGLGGYNDAKLGLHLEFSGSSWSVGWTEGVFDPTLVEWNKRCNWSQEERNENFVELTHLISKTLSEAKVTSIEKLKGTPVELTFDGNQLKSWRILTEVL